MQYFKGDDIEIRVEGAASVAIAQLCQELTNWFNDAYNSAGLGEILYDNNLVPLTNAVARDIFVKNYGQILEKWEYVGSFESYLYVFMQIFGPNTNISFTRLAPGALQIDIVTDQTQFFNWLAKKSGADYIATPGGDAVQLRTVKGIGNFYEVQGVLNSLNPAGVYLLVNFTLQGA